MRIIDHTGVSISVTNGNVSYSAPLLLDSCLVISADAAYKAAGSTGSIALQWSNDNVNYYDLAATSTNISTDSVVGWAPNYWIGFKYLRIRLTSTSGAIRAVFSMVAKGG